MPVVTAAVAVLVERKVPSKTEATALLLLVSGVIISVFEGQASGSSYGITLSITGTLHAFLRLPSQTYQLIMLQSTEPERLASASWQQAACRAASSPFRRS